MSYNLVGVVFGGILIAGGVGLKVVFWKKRGKRKKKGEKTGIEGKGEC